MNYELVCCVVAYRGNKKLYLQGANLQDADLRGADLRWANLQGADLRGANLPKTLLVIQAGCFSVYVHKSGGIRIGCCERSLQQWINLSERRLALLDHSALSWKKEYGDFVIATAENFIEDYTV